MAGKRATLNMTNKEILDAVAQNENTSDGVRRAIASVTDSDVVTLASYEQAYTGITASEQLMNEFIGALNLIANVFVRNVRMWSNPMERFYRDDLEYGDTIEEIAIKLYQSHNYKSQGTPGDVFKQERPDVVTMLHKINHEVFYETSISYAEFRKAFLNDRGLSRFITSNWTTLVNSDKRDNFEEMKKTLTDNYKFGKMRQIHIEDPTASEDAIKDLAVLIRETATNWQFLQGDYNAYEVETFTPTADVYVFVTPDIDASLIVKALAYAFNREDADFVGNVVRVNKWDLPGKNVFMCDGDAFMCFTKLFESHAQWDARHLVFNVYLHDHALYSFSQFLNSVCLTTNDVNDDTVTAVAVTPGLETITKGQTETCTAEVTGDESNAVFWTVSGASSNDTYINDAGTLYAAADEKTGTKLQVTAVSQKNNKIFGSATVTVS